ncbi:hypothetical protein H9L10_08460 [Phycicoccus endophyticus]|uniref:Uncharacterized protein n=1 Tax=Phycicoccus endophyticus TaxID=1690220 RepID=A0A7G9QYF8_9MICO|nr:hypothetical protein [Phycicoccus endophyticus]NHI19279.1 hypothetical protein [Phycicoccus endophyticus]QNN48383.1 hypothetical protein H9L10_08460 [Phycicoccus endophyticus]GGL41477.1 hypothetical protein GCM10012283_25130 [Phycicoccus endophyticus]
MSLTMRPRCERRDLDLPLETPPPSPPVARLTRTPERGTGERAALRARWTS